MELNLEQVDVDGAIAEAHEEAMGDTRANFLRKAGLGAGAFIGGGAVLGAFASSAMASGSGAAPGGAVGILNYALTLEYLERAFYEEATKNGIANRDAQLINYLRTTTRDEKAHVAFLQKALGKKAIKQPKFDFGKAVTDKATFAATSYVLENTGVHAYLGQLPYILGSPTYAAAAASIVTIEARHSGAIALYLGKNIDNPGSFDKGESYDTIIKAVKGTGFLK